MSCDLCNLCGFSNPSCIPGSGPKKAKIMIINAAAGDADEQNEEATMEGIVKRTLENCGYKLENIYYTNAIKCRTPKGYKIKVSEIKKCKEYLHKEIKKVKPKYVLLLGAQACQAALDMKMSELQGTPYVKDGITYYSTYSPRVLYYDAAKAPQVERELTSFWELTQGKKVNKKGKLNTKMLTTLEEVKEAFKDYKSKYKSISYDIESTGLDRFEDVITLFGFGNTKVQYQIPLMVKYSPLRYKPIAQKKIMQYAIRQIQTFRWQIAANGKFDDLFLEQHFGIKPFCNFDTNMASHLLDENTPDGLKDSAIRELGAPNWDVNTTLKKGTVETEEQFEEFCKYNGYDIYYTHKLFLHYKKVLEEDSALYKLQHYLMCPAGRAYEEIQRKGIYINPEAYNKSKKELYAKRDRIEKELIELIPKKIRKEYQDINWNSVDQVSKLLFKEMGMTPLDKTPTGKPQINESVLKRLDHPLCNKLVEHRGVSTAIGTFVDGWGKLIKPNWRVYTNFNLIGTVTGRTSSSNPNLQQLPRDTSIRCWVDAPEGYTFVTADYSQLELRMAAVVSGDRRMTELFFEGADIHMNTAMSITGKKPEDIEKEERKQAKSCFTGETEILTPQGWCRLDEYNGMDVAQYDKDTGEITFVQPYHYDRVRSGSVYTFEDRNISLSLTSDHNILFKMRSGKIYKDEAIKFQDKSGYMISAGNYPLNNSYKLSEIETRVLALIVSDSNYVSPGIWRFGFTKPRKIERFKNLMVEANIEFETYENQGITKFVINNWNLYRKLIRYCGPDKILSWDCINELDGKIYLEEASYWGGCQGWDNTKYVRFSPTKKQTAEVMQVMGALNNMRVSLRRKTHRDRRYNDTYQLTYRLGRKDTSRVNLHLKQKLGVHWTYCLQVPKGCLVIRHNDKISIQGNCNFGFLYGMQFRKFKDYARDSYGVNVSEKEAKAFRQSFFDEYADLLPWHDKQRKMVRAEGMVRNPIGRIRHLPDIYSLEKSKQAEAERQSINSPVQGFGSDVAISAIVELVNTVPEEIGYLVGSVHDSIECLVKTEYVEWFSEYVLQTMSNPRILKEIFQFETKVPIVSDLEVGPFGLGVELEDWLKTNTVPQKEGWLKDWNPRDILPPRYKKKRK